jgi:hypothetical protein
VPSHYRLPQCCAVVQSAPVVERRGSTGVDVALLIAHQDIPTHWPPTPSAPPFRSDCAHIRGGRGSDPRLLRLTMNALLDRTSGERPRGPRIVRDQRSGFPNDSVATGIGQSSCVAVTNVSSVPVLRHADLLGDASSISCRTPTSFLQSSHLPKWSGGEKSTPGDLGRLVALPQRLGLWGPSGGVSGLGSRPVAPDRPINTPPTSAGAMRRVGRGGRLQTTQVDLSRAYADVITQWQTPSVRAGW